MQKHTMASRNYPPYAHSGVTAVLTHRRGISGSVPVPLRRLDPVYDALSQLGLVTPRLQEQYWLNRRKALEGLTEQIVFLQHLYEGNRLDSNTGGESVQVDAMELNIHLIRTASFGNYSTAERVNILYQLRRALNILLKQYFPQIISAASAS